MGRKSHFCEKCGAIRDLRSLPESDRRRCGSSASFVVSARRARTWIVRLMQKLIRSLVSDKPSIVRTQPSAASLINRCSVPFERETPKPSGSKHAYRSSIFLMNVSVSEILSLRISGLALTQFLVDPQDRHHGSVPLAGPISRGRRYLQRHREQWHNESRGQEPHQPALRMASLLLPRLL